MECSSEIRRNKLLTHAAWLNLKNMNIKWEKPQATDHILYNSILWNIQKIPKTGLCIVTKNYWFVHSEWVNFIIWKLDLNTLLSTVCNSVSGSASEALAQSLFWGLSRQDKSTRRPAEQNHAGVTAPLVRRGANTALPALPALVNYIPCVISRWLTVRCYSFLRRKGFQCLYLIKASWTWGGKNTPVRLRTTIHLYTIQHEFIVKSGSSCFIKPDV